MNTHDNPFCALLTLSMFGLPAMVGLLAHQGLVPAGIAGLVGFAAMFLCGALACTVEPVTYGAMLADSRADG